MKRNLIVLVSCLTLGAAQWVQPKTPAVHRTARDLISDETVDPHVRSILRRACADCHSNNAHLPWYGRISPVSWLIAGHITRGREKLNFSEWPLHSDNERQDIADSIDKQQMPLPSYTWIHPDARLSANDRKVIERWADAR